MKPYEKNYQDHRRDVKNILVALRREMKPIKKVDEQSDVQDYQFEGKLEHNVSFNGEYKLDKQKQTESAFVYLMKGDKDIGVIVTEQGFVEKSPNLFWHGRNIGGVRYVAETTAISVYSPNWDVKDGLAYKTAEQNDSGQMVNQINVYHAPQESALEVLDNLSDAVYHDQEQTTGKSRLSKIFNRTKDNGREM